MTLEEVTKQLRQLYESQCRYQFIDQAHQVLSMVPTAPELARMTLCALVELGFGGPARELLQLRNDLYSNAEERSWLQSSIAAVPNGRIPWAQCTEILDKNLSALLNGRSELKEWADSLPNLLFQVHLYRSSQGYYVISRRRAGKLREWLGDLSTLEDQASLNIPPRGQLGPTVVVGVRISSVLKKIYEDTQHLLLSYSHPLYIIEPDPVRFSAWLHCSDHTWLLSDDRVYVFVGDAAIDRFNRLLVDNPRLPLPTVTLDFTPETSSAAQIQELVGHLVSHRKDELRRVSEELQNRYKDRDTSYWAERFQSPGTVFGVTSRFTTMLRYSTRDALLALEKLGYQTEIILESSDHELIPPVEHCRKILELDPIMLIYLDHLRYEFPHLPDNLPLLSWFQDPLPNILCRKAGESIGPLDFVCGYYRSECVNEYGYPESQFFSTRVPVSTRVFHDGPVPVEQRERLQCDIMYVGHAPHSMSSYIEQIKSEISPLVHPVLDSIHQEIQHILQNYKHLDHETARSITQQHMSSAGLILPDDELKRLSNLYTLRLFDIGFRFQSLKWAADWAQRKDRIFKLYGEGWHENPDLSKYAMGPIEHGEPLREAYRCAKLVLQTIPSGFLHQRTFEALISGSLVLSRYTPNNFSGYSIEEFDQNSKDGRELWGAAKIFPGLKRVVFRDSQEFERLTEKYLTNESLYEEVCLEFREIVQNKYTYYVTMKEQMSNIRKVLQEESVTVQC